MTKYAGVWLPFLKARDAGLWLYWVTEKEVVCCACPSIHIKDNRLHCETGPAVSWPDSPTCFYYLKGVQITEDILNRRFTWKDIDAQSNSEVRRIMMDLYGPARYIKDAGIAPVHSDDFGTLYRRDNGDGTVFTVVKVVNSTAEPDGSFNDYWLRVNDTLYGGDVGRIAHAAVASTWRTKDGKLAFQRWQEYMPAYES